MTFIRSVLLGTFLTALLFAAPAKAETPGVPSWISEGKVGLMTHDSYTFDDHFLEFWKNRKEPGMDVNFELLFNGPDFLKYLLTPRIQLGMDISTNGPGTDYAYTGLDWQHDFDSGIFLGGFFGLAIHNGKLDVAQDDNGVITPQSQARFDRTKRLGSRVLFHLGPEVGYAWDEHNALSLTWAHLSNGHILASGDKPNEGIDNVGIRYGYKF